MTLTKKKLPAVIFDSSFLMSVVESPTTWFEDIADQFGAFEPVLLGCVGGELERIASSQRARSRTARAALDMVGSFSRVPCGDASVDSEIVSSALRMGAAVATTDGALAGTLASLHVGVIMLRSGRVSRA